MARIGFHGFKSGTAVELALRKLGRKVQARTENWRDPDAVEVSSDGWEEIPATAEVEVTVHRSDMQVAPELIMVRVIGYTGFDTPGPAEGEEYDRRYHELYYLWDYDDPDGPEWTAPVNVMPHMRNANVGYGPTGAHVYTKPGTYNPSVIVYEPSTGKLAKHRLDPVVVQDREDVFAGYRTIYVHKDADYSKAPVDAQTVDNLADAFALAWVNSARRILVASDQTILCPSYSFGNQFRGNNKYYNFFLEGARDGARPVIEQDPASGIVNSLLTFNKMFRDGRPGFDVTFLNLHVKGPWNGDEEYGNHNFGFRLNPQEDGLGTTYMLHHDCFWEKFSTFSYTFGNQDLTAGFSNTTFYDWSDLAIFGGCRRMAHLGTAIRQNPNSFQGGPKYQPFNNHGPVRLAGGDYCVVDGSDYFSCNGWSGIAGYQAMQPCWRWNFTGETTGAAMNMQRTVCEGGVAVLSLGHMNNDKAISTNNMLIEKTMLIGGIQTQSLIGLQYGGLTLRNVVGIMPNNRRQSPYIRPQCFISFSNKGLVTGDEIGPIVIEHDTFVNLVSEDGYLWDDAEPWEGLELFHENQFNPASLVDGIVIERHNVLHQPNLRTPITPFGPLDTTPVFEARSLGYKVSNWDNLRLTEAEAETKVIDIPFPTQDFNKVPYDPPLAQGDFANGNHYIGWDNKDRIKSGEVTVQITASGMRVEATEGNSLPANKHITWKMDRNQGPRPVERDTRPATPPGSIATFAPMEGSEALGAASEDACAIDDFFGNRRPAYPSYGALELAD